MADEWWSSSRAAGGEEDDGDGASACSTAPATESAASNASSSMSFGGQHGLTHDAAAGGAAASSSFLGDPHLDWTQAFMGGKAAAAADQGATGFNALLQFQLHGDASGHSFLLDGEAPPFVPTAYVAGEVTAPSQGAVSYSDSQYPGYAFSQLLKSDSSSSPSSQQQQQFPGFFGSPGLFGAAAPEPPPPPPQQLLLQALDLEPKPVNNHLKEPAQDASSSATTRRSSSSQDAPAPAPAPPPKKPRISPPSPLPTFKVRKEKLGDRITALQQLVSPFGKTDTASVLHEAIEYIRFLHDQVASLSSPYLRCGRPVQLQNPQGSDKAKDGGEVRSDLRSQGLCLVPVTSTYTMASETAPEFWHPSFGGTFR